MELAVSQTCQSVRRAGKRFLITKLGASNNQNKTDKSSSRNFPVQNPKFNVCANPEKHFPMCVFPVHNLQPARFTKLQSPFIQNKNIKILSRFFHNNYSNLSWISSTEIEETLASNSIPYTKKHTCYLTTCCFDCVEKSYEEFNLFINPGSGNIICKKCGKRSSWRELKQKFSESVSNENLENSTPIFNLNLANEIVDENIFKNAMEIQSSNHTLLPKDYQKISCDIYKKYKVSFINENHKTYFLFPYFDITKKSLNGFKKTLVNSNSSEITKTCDELGLFGWHVITDNVKDIVLTCNEFDALAITETLSIPSLSLPFGSTMLPPGLLPFLEQFDHITLWFNNEYKSKENLNQFARKLGLDRCSVVNCHDDSSPFTLLQNSGKDKLLDSYSQRRHLKHEHIVTFKELIDSVYNDLIHAKENAGIQFKRFPTLNDYLKGHRRGELTIFTGPTGSGKTTFLSELSLDLCTQGVRTLWGSFEIKNHRLINILLHQYSGLKIEQQMDKFHEYGQSFQLLPFYFMTYYGAQDLGMVLKTIKYAVYNYDIEHIIIDNLQFMISVNRGEDRFVAMDKAISAFRSCASEENVHITVVVHPRKENDGSSLQTASIYGSAKASQEADNVLILQNSENLSMQISKNRFSGSIGTIPLKFNPDSLCLSGYYRNPITGEEILPFLKPKRPIQKLKVYKKGNDHEQ